MAHSTLGAGQGDSKCLGGLSQDPNPYRLLHSGAAPPTLLCLSYLPLIECREALASSGLPAKSDTGSPPPSSAPTRLWLRQESDTVPSSLLPTSQNEEGMHDRAPWGICQQLSDSVLGGLHQPFTCCYRIPPLQTSKPEERMETSLPSFFLPWDQLEVIQPEEPRRVQLFAVFQQHLAYMGES